MDLFSPTPTPSLFKVNLRTAPLRRMGEKGAAACTLQTSSRITPWDNTKGDPRGPAPPTLCFLAFCLYSQDLLHFNHLNVSVSHTYREHCQLKGCLIYRSTSSPRTQPAFGYLQDSCCFGGNKGDMVKYGFYRWNGHTWTLGEIQATKNPMKERIY